jgi:hypothetical protein
MSASSVRFPIQDGLNAMQSPRPELNPTALCEAL